MSAPSNSVSVRVPASTSNCGAGFDALGLALTLYNRVHLQLRADNQFHPERAEDGRAAEMVAQTAEAFFAAAQKPVSGFSYRIEGDVPPARGLGSSMTVIGGVLAGLNVLLETKLTPHQLVTIATELEGHPDNASAAILGGFTVSRCDPGSGAYVDSVRVTPPPDLLFVVASPQVELLTKESRGALPATLPYFDAVKSINSAAYLAAVFATGAYEKLQHAVGDFMHEPYRLPKIRGGRAAIDAGVVAGALTGWLSGSGSSVLCVCRQGRETAVAAAMASAFAAEKIGCETRALRADNEGVRVEQG